MKIKIVKIVLVTASLLLVSYFSYLWIFKSEVSKIEITTAVVKKGDVSKYITATGTVQPIKQVEIGTQVSGIVKKVYVDYNSIVKKGQLIAELDKTNLLAALADAKSNYNKAITERDYLQSVYNRQNNLYKDKLITQIEFDQAEYNLRSVQQNVALRLSDLQKAQTNLSFASIYSPIDGVILAKSISEGQTVAASLNAPVLFTVAQDLKEMQVEAAVDEADIGNVKIGQRVSFTVDAFLDKEFFGKITQVRLSPTVTSNVVTYTVVIKAENEELKLMPGLTATITIFTEEVKDVLQIDASVLNFRANRELIKAYNLQENPNLEKEGKENSKDGERVKKEKSENSLLIFVKKNGQLKPKKIKVGISNGFVVHIIEGLEEGEEVVTSISQSGEQSKSTQGGDASSPFMPKKPSKKR
jgi:HlyD family secretion protein